MIAGVVLAGGQSSRMGCDKSQLEISGISLLEHSQNALLKSGIQDVFISGKSGIADKLKNKGPLVGIISCLEQLRNFNHVLFTTVDMPLVDSIIFKHLINQHVSNITYIENYFFPLLISNTKSIRNRINELINTENLSIKNMLKSLESTSIINQFDPVLFSNANTQNEWKEILKLMNNKE